jgi:hypothetical protein
MHRRSMLTTLRRTPAHQAALRFTAACALITLLAGCATGAAQPPATLAGGASQGATSATPSATATVAGQIPADYKVDIEINPSGDATQDALIQQTRAMLMAYEQAVSRNAPNDPLYESLTTAKARINLYSMVGVFAAAGERPTGSVRFYQFTAKPVGSVADVLFCEDTSKVIPVSFTTGKKTGAAATGTAAYSWWDTGFKKDSGGTWTIVYVASQVGRQSCM